MIKLNQSKFFSFLLIREGGITASKFRRNTMEKYVNPEIVVLDTAADVISASITYDDNETVEDKFFTV